ncbi:MAG TPA: ABC transporter ATP-binding protein [Terriglobia bacterium]|nr:ABC transporter ATP-binding protein [Terriglobia bacterium]
MTEPVTTTIDSTAKGTGELIADAVSFRFAQFALSPISLKARAGELMAIIGPNGSGKSTLLDILSGHLKPKTGGVFLDGQNLHGLSPRERARKVGLARQDTILLFSFEVQEFVRQGRHPHLGNSLFESPEDDRWVAWALEKTCLQEFAYRRVMEMSSGEFQRAVLARTLAQRPRLVLLDEPTANLDIGYQVEMFRLLRQLAKSENFIGIVVTHELNLAAEMADYVVLLEGGNCLRQGKAEEVFQADLLSRAFRTPVLVDKNPSSGRPRVTWVAP